MRERKNIFNVIFLLCFIGIIISFSLYFYMSGSLGGEGTEGDFFGLTYSVSDDDLYGYDSRFMKNQRIHSLIIESEYKAFGNVKQEDVIRGKHGFLFDFGSNKFGYDYASDYFGGRVLTDNELAAFYRNLDLRRRIYEEQGRYYVLAVIPNSQTVYSEYMPSYFSTVSENTMLGQLSAYMEYKGAEYFIDLTDYIDASKSAGVLYNNTENSINALGAYFVYGAIMSKLPEDAVSSDRILDISDYSYYTHYTDGKATAVAAGLESIIRNETVSMSNQTEFKYAVLTASENLETTYVKSVYKNEISDNPAVLIDCSNEWDKIQLMPYFSNTFGMTSYKTGHKYSAEVLEITNPKIVIQTVHEDELPLLLDGTVNLTYLNALGRENTSYKTVTPAQIEYVVTERNSVCISGIIEADAEVRVFGEGVELVSTKAIDGRFFVSLSFDGDVRGREIFIDAKTPDKLASDYVSVIISPDSDKVGNGEVSVGINSMLYSSDYNVPSMPSEDQLAIYRAALEDSVKHILSSCDNNPRLLVSMIPRKLSVYTEGIADELYPQLQAMQEIKEACFELLGDAGVETLDLSRIMRESAVSEKMFYQTDEVITDLAYYYMYCEIVNKLYNISDNHQRAFLPIRPEFFIEYTMPVANGVHAESLGFDITETVTRLKYTNGKKIAMASNGARVYYCDDDSLPTAVIACDKVSEPLLNLITEHFRYCYVLKTGEMSIPDSVLSSVDPDFVIYLCDEGTIDLSIEH